MPNNEYIFIFSPSGFAELNGQQNFSSPNRGGVAKGDGGVFNNQNYIRWHTPITDLPHKAPKENSIPQSSQKPSNI